MALPFEQELLALPLKKLLRLTSLLTEMYPKEAAEARLRSQKKGEEQKKRIANRLIESVLPIFVEDENGRPTRLGTCVLVLVDSNFFAFTAGHVLDDAGRSTLLVPADGKLIPLPSSESFRSSRNCDGRDLDVGVIPLSATGLGGIAQKVFLALTDRDEAICQMNLVWHRSISFSAFRRRGSCSRLTMGTGEFSSIRSKFRHPLLNPEHMRRKASPRPIMSLWNLTEKK
jgi:hypothetical protein